MIRNIGGGVLGLMMGFMLVWLIEQIGHTVYPPPVDIDFSDSEAVQAYIATLPVGALLFVGAAWVIGAFVGVTVACRIGGAKPVIYTAVIGGFVLAGAIVTMIKIPHSMWFAVGSLLAIIVAAISAMLLASASTPTEVHPE